MHAQMFIFNCTHVGEKETKQNGTWGEEGKGEKPLKVLD